MSSTLTLQRLLDYYPIAQSLADALSTHGCYAKDLKAQLHLDNHHTCPSPAWCLAATCEGAYDLLAPEVYHTMHIDPSSDQQAKIAEGLLPCARRAVRRVIIDISSAGTWLEPFLESLTQLESLTLSFAPCTNGLALRGVTIPASVRQLSLICPSLELVQHLFAARWSCKGSGTGRAMGAHAGMLERWTQRDAQMSKSQTVVDDLGLGALSRTFIWTWIFDDRSLASWVSMASQLPGEVLIYAKHICCLPHGLEDIDELVKAIHSIAQPLAPRIILVWTIERSLQVTYLDLDPASGTYNSHTAAYTLGSGVSDWDGMDSADQAWAKLRQAECSR